MNEIVKSVNKHSIAIDTSFSHIGCINSLPYSFFLSHFLALDSAPSLCKIKFELCLKHFLRTVLYLFLCFFIQSKKKGV